MMKRSEKLAFFGVGSDNSVTYKRMTGFTELTKSMNPKEYTRKYVDEDAERSSVVAYAPSMAYKFDFEPGNEVHEEFLKVSENELVGDAAVAAIVLVDLSTSATGGGTSFNAVMRDFTIIPSSEGDDADTMTYSGTLKAYGPLKVGTATTNDEWQTLTFTESD